MRKQFAGCVHHLQAIASTGRHRSFPARRAFHRIFSVLFWRCPALTRSAYNIRMVHKETDDRPVVHIFPDLPPHLQAWQKESTRRSRGSIPPSPPCLQAGQRPGSGRCTWNSALTRHGCVCGGFRYGGFTAIDGCHRINRLGAQLFPSSRWPRRLSLARLLPCTGGRAPHRNGKPISFHITRARRRYVACAPMKPSWLR